MAENSGSAGTPPWVKVSGIVIIVLVVVVVIVLVLGRGGHGPGRHSLASNTPGNDPRVSHTGITHAQP